jgi:predicted PurR-regulated permease PerM
MTRRQIYTRLIVHLLFYLAICLFCIFVLPKLAVFFLPFLFGWIIAMIANPLVHFLEKHIKIVRKHGSVLVIVGVIAIIGAAIYGLGLVAVHEISSLMEDLPEFYDEFLTRLALLSEQLSGMLKNIPVLSKNAGNLMEDLP